MRIQRFLIALLVCLLGAGRSVPGWAGPFLAIPTSGASCSAAIAAAEQAGAIPSLLMAAIGRVESGRRDPASGVMKPWPWTINAEGQGSYYDSKAQAIAAVRALQARGVQSIDVGCMQINLVQHPNAFTSLDQAFDPSANATYAAHFLNDLHGQTNDWLRAAAQYHSSTPALALPYQASVEAAWVEERHMASVTTPITGVWPGAAPGAASGAALGAASGAVRPTAGGGFHGVVPTMSREIHQVGRDLTAYRLTPILFATRPPPLVRRD